MSPRNGALSIELVFGVAQQAGDHEALARAELDRRLGAAGGQRRNVEAVELDAPSLDSSLTSGRTRIEMRPSARTIGVKARPTPYCLYSIVTAPSDCEIGTGNSPPARKLAVSPESAVRFGSASVVTRPSVSPRSSVPSRSRPSRWPAAPSVVPTDAMLNAFGMASCAAPAWRADRARVALADAELEAAGRVAAEKVDADLLERACG